MRISNSSINFNKSIFFPNQIRNGFAPIKDLYKMSEIKVFSVEFLYDFSSHKILSKLMSTTLIIS